MWLIQIHNVKWLYRLDEKPTLSEWGNYEEPHLMKHGTPLYFMISVRAWLNNHFSGRWIGRRRPTELPLRLLKRKKALSLFFPRFRSAGVYTEI